MLTLVFMSICSALVGCGPDEPDQPNADPTPSPVPTPGPNPGGDFELSSNILGYWMGESVDNYVISFDAQNVFSAYEKNDGKLNSLSGYYIYEPSSKMLVTGVDDFGSADISLYKVIKLKNGLMTICFVKDLSDEISSSSVNKGELNKLASKYAASIPSMKVDEIDYEQFSILSKSEFEQWSRMNSESSSLLSVSPTKLTLQSSKNSEGTVTVTSSGIWTASTQASWISVSPASGQKNGLLYIKALTDNSGINERMATIEVKCGEKRVEIIVSQLAGNSESGNKEEILTYQIDGKTYKFIEVRSKAGEVAPFRMMQTELPIGKDIKINGVWIDRLDRDGDGHVIRSEFRSFLDDLIAKTGLDFRLPTKAEWRFAATGGDKSLNTIYAGSNSLSEVGWYKANSNKSAKDIALLAPNELGFYDMSGNMAEVTNDSDDKYFIDGNCCGGAWNDAENDCTVTSYKPGKQSGNILNTRLREKNAFDGRYNTIRLIYSCH